MDSEPFGPQPPSCLDLILQHNKSVVHKGLLKHRDLSASIVDIHLNINLLNRKDTKAQRNEAPSPRSQQGHSCIAISSRIFIDIVGS